MGVSTDAFNSRTPKSMFFLVFEIFLLAKSQLGRIDEEIELKRQLFGEINGSKRYDNEVIQNRWRKTVESDITSIGIRRLYTFETKIH